MSRGPSGGTGRPIAERTVSHEKKGFRKEELQPKRQHSENHTTSQNPHPSAAGFLNPSGSHSFLARISRCALSKTTALPILSGSVPKICVD